MILDTPNDNLPVYDFLHEALVRSTVMDDLGLTPEMGARQKIFESLRIVYNAYGWTIGDDGKIYGLVRGDQGYEETHIQVPVSHLEVLIKEKCDADAVARSGGFAGAAARAVKYSIHKRPTGDAWDMPTPIGDYQVFERQWVDFRGISHICENMDSGIRAARDHYTSTIVSCLRESD